MIVVENASKVYGKKAQQFSALDEVSFTIPDTTTVAIIGKSGSGKSTLMHIMSGLDHLTNGSVTIDGQALGDMKPKIVDKFRAEKIGFIFQSFFVQANESCYHNVALPLEIAHVSGRQRKAMVLDALEKVELSDKVNARARTLSGGQKQRLAIARAIVNKPRILFADEPTGNLDSKTSAVIEKLLFDLNKEIGGTLVIVTHDEELAGKCDMQVHLKDGKIQKINSKGEKR